MLLRHQIFAVKEDHAAVLQPSIKVLAGHRSKKEYPRSTHKHVHAYSKARTEATKPQCEKNMKMHLPYRARLGLWLYSE
jgi:hypothetical protein